MTGPVPVELPAGRVPAGRPDRASVGAGHAIHDLLPVLIRAPRVDLRFVVPDELRRPVHDALGIDPLRGRISQVYLLDTPALALTSRGVAVQARRVQDSKGQATVTHRHLPPSQVPTAVRSSSSFDTSVDVVPEGFVCSASLVRAVDNALVRRAARGRAPVSRQFSKAQRRFYLANDHAAPALDRLVMLGPLHVVQHKARLPELDRPLRAQQWFFPDGSRRVELSVRCSPDEAFDVTRAVKDCVASRGLELAGDKETLVRRAVMHLLASGGALSL